MHRTLASAVSLCVRACVYMCSGGWGGGHLAFWDFLTLFPCPLFSGFLFTWLLFCSVLAPGPAAPPHCASVLEAPLGQVLACRCPTPPALQCFLPGASARTWAAAGTALPGPPRFPAHTAGLFRDSPVLGCIWHPIAALYFLPHRHR